MNICMLAPTYLPHIGGTELAVQNLANNLTEFGYRITIITLTPNVSSIPQNEKVRVIRVRFVRAWGTQYFSSNVACFRQVLKQHKEQPFDYLHSFTFLPLGITSTFLKKTLRLPLITSLMGADTYSPQPEMAQPYLGRFSHLVAPWVMNSSDIVTAPSKDLARHALRQGCKKELVVIPHGVDPERFDPSATRTKGRRVRARLGISKDGFMLLTVHRLDKRKDLATAILALRNVLRHMSDVKLIVVGVGPEHERFQEIARREGVDSSIVFVGSVSDQDLPSYYAAADVFLLSSFYEAFGLVLLEAMAAGKCVIASNTGGVAEVVRNKETGFLFPVGDVDALTAIVLDVLEDEGLRLKMGRLGHKRVLEHYTWAEISKRYYDLYAQPSTEYK